MSAVPLLDLSDPEFQDAWRGMSITERSDLPADVRGRGYARFNELTRYIDTSNASAQRAAQRRAAADVVDGQPLNGNRSGGPSAFLRGQADDSGASVRIIRGDAVKIEPEKWVWSFGLPESQLALFSGAGGTGKTTAAISLAARVSRGAAFPDGERTKAGDVMMWSGEDTRNTLATRYRAANADMTRIHFVGAFESGAEGERKKRPFDPARDFAQLVEAAKGIPNLRLVIIDPVVVMVLGDSNKNAEVRRGLQPLVDLGEQTGAAVIGVTHNSKGTQGREPNERVTGSLAFAALARVILMFAKVDEAHGGGRVMVRTKNNLGPDGGGFKYDLEVVDLGGGISGSRVKWGEAIEGAARDILAAAEVAPDEDGEERQGAAEWLKALLADAELLKTEVMRRGAEAGFPQRTLQHARARIGAEAVVTGFGAEKRSVWRMPIRAITSPIVPIVPTSETGTHGTNGGTNADREAF